MSLMRRVKAVFWWCYLHTVDPLPPKGDRVVCEELHGKDPYPFWLD